MAYFDSEKNKAMWEKRLTFLEQERDRRKAQGFRPIDRNQMKQDGAEPVRQGVREITFEELCAKEEKRRQMQKNAAVQRTRQMQPAGPQMESVRSM